MLRRVAFGLGLLDALCVVAGIASAWAFWLWLAPNLQHLVQVGLWELFLPNPWMPAGAAVPPHPLRPSAGGWARRPPAARPPPSARPPARPPARLSQGARACPPLLPAEA